MDTTILGYIECSFRLRDKTMIVDCTCNVSGRQNMFYQVMVYFV